ncbi:zinc finger MYM-type protein 1-like isoform X2 [Gouania willdenowi]|uniref:zinc finger MYM-type protein 1-like isoform X2 n=1 Tax=Gouania willdenowi TaxID=441366 RepID=UPI0010542418|nr:zinc finger MYM-type protein 1-like isoform X2 [Gouania willdenowi]
MDANAPMSWMMIVVKKEEEEEEKKEEMVWKEVKLSETVSKEEVLCHHDQLLDEMCTANVEKRPEEETEEFPLIINGVDYLSTVQFDTLPLQQKLEIKRLGPHKPEDFTIFQEEKCKKRKDSTRSFKQEWFKRKNWLTASHSKKALFCFPCLLFGGETVWTTTGFKDLKHLSERLVKHESCASHVDNAIKLSLLGTKNVASQLNSAYKRSIELHNRQTEENRYVLGRIITCIELCGKCEIALRGHDETASSLNPAIFKSIFETMCEGDSRLRRHYDSQPYFKGTSAMIQNELLDCMYSVYRDVVTQQLVDAPFVAVQVDDTTDISCKSKMVIVLRYMVNNTVTERFWEFIEVKDKSAAGLSNAIIESLEPLNLGNKLIAQAYDGTAVIGGCVSGVQALVKERYPNAHFVHCHTHQLNMTLQQTCSARIPKLKVFFADLSAFAEFFSNSPKRAAALASTSKRNIPRPSATQWNFKSQTVNAVWVCRQEIKECLDNMRTQEGWDRVTISEAYGLSMHLQDPEFLHFLHFFSELMPEVDILYSVLQKPKIDVAGINQGMETFKKNLGRLREQADAIIQESEAEGNKRRKTDTALVMKEACDTVLGQGEERFTNFTKSDHLIAAKLTNCTLFPKFVRSFPQAELERAVKLWPKTNKNTMGQQRLNALAMLSIENELIQGLPDFKSKVIEMFAHMKDRQASFLFKK